MTRRDFLTLLGSATRRGHSQQVSSSRRCLSAQGSIRIAPLITSPMTMLVQNNHDRSLSLMAATTRNTLSTNHAPIITSSVRMDRAENNSLTQAAATTVSCSNEAGHSRDTCHVNVCPAGG
jgi:hypothetical protein